MNDFDKARILKNIEKNGCHITHVDAEETSPSFTYSIGIEKSTGHPDVIITGMDKDSAHFLINEYNFRIKDGESFEADKFYDEFLEDAQVTFKTVAPKHYDRYFPLGQWYYEGDNFTALHFIWPDLSGIWPWEKKANKDHRYLIPPLYKR